jgi:hypothetical protein
MESVYKGETFYKSVCSKEMLRGDVSRRIGFNVCFAVMYITYKIYIYLLYYS